METLPLAAGMRRSLARHWGPLLTGVGATVLAAIACSDATGLVTVGVPVSIVPHLASAQVSPVAFDSVHLTIYPVARGQIDQQPVMVVDTTIASGGGPVSIRLQIPLLTGRAEDFYAYLSLINSQGFTVLSGSAQITVSASASVAPQVIDIPMNSP